MDLEATLLAAIMKAAGNPKRVTRWPQRGLEVEQYWLTQYGRVVAFNSGAAGAGIVTAAVLSVPSTCSEAWLT